MFASNSPGRQWAVAVCSVPFTGRAETRGSVPQGWDPKCHSSFCLRKRPPFPISFIFTASLQCQFGSAFCRSLLTLAIPFGFSPGDVSCSAHPLSILPLLLPLLLQIDQPVATFVLGFCYCGSCLPTQLLLCCWGQPQSPLLPLLPPLMQFFLSSFVYTTNSAPLVMMKIKSWKDYSREISEPGRQYGKGVS
jgi:hypothetical protein